MLTAALVAWAAVRIVPGQQRPRYPGTSWAKASSPAQAGWSTEKLRLARDYSESIGTAALMIVADGAIAY